MQLWKRTADLKVTNSFSTGSGAKVSFADPNGVEVKFNPFVKTLTAASTLTEAQNGYTFVLNSATEFATTLPLPKAGLRFSFLVGAAPASASYTIVSNGSANIIVGHVLSSDLNAANDSDSEASGGDTITLVDGVATVGDRVDLISDGTSWFMTGMCAAYNAITITTAS